MRRHSTVKVLVNRAVTLTEKRVRPFLRLRSHPEFYLVLIHFGGEPGESIKLNEGKLDADF